MRKIPTIFLQGVIFLIGVATLALLIWLPTTEGRATNLDLFSIYADPFILYGYGTSTLFFSALYNAFKLLGYIGQNKAFSTKSLKALRNIKHHAILFSLFIVVAGVYIKLGHNQDDDPAGFLGLCAIATFIAIVIATAAAVFERLIQKAIEIKSENDLTI